MTDVTQRDHAALAETLRRRVLDGSGQVPAALRRAVASRAAGGSAPVEAPIDILAQKIADTSWRVTDAEVQAVVAALGGQKAAFEIVATAAMGAGLRRWDKGMAALKETEHAAE